MQRACTKTETTSCLLPHLPVSMTTRGLEDLDGGLGSCLPNDDLPFLEEPPSGRRPDSKARGTVTEGGAAGNSALETRSGLEPMMRHTVCLWAKVSLSPMPLVIWSGSCITHLLAELGRRWDHIH